MCCNYCPSWNWNLADKDLLNAFLPRPRVTCPNAVHQKEVTGFCWLRHVSHYALFTECDRTVGTWRVSLRPFHTAWPSDETLGTLFRHTWNTNSCVISVWILWSVRQRGNSLLQGSQVAFVLQGEGLKWNLDDCALALHPGCFKTLPSTDRPFRVCVCDRHTGARLCVFLVCI